MNEAADTSTQPLTDYDRFAAQYAAHTAVSLYNAGYERPAILRELNDVANKRILDVGCASGELSAALLARGAAEVVGLDRSALLLDLARQRNAACADRSRFVQSDLEGELPELGQFDVIACSLVLHYLRDWRPVLSRFRQMLVAGGRLVISTHHPETTTHRVDNYFETTIVEDTWLINGIATEVRYFHRPLSAIIAPIIGAGFAVTSVVEPQYLPVHGIPDDNDQRLLNTMPVFVIIVAS
jgi:2-polyprenyl-3-methyl-5-hydroxy-6-metoxy-1,4-benzoquinol methylase